MVNSAAGAEVSAEYPQDLAATAPRPHKDEAAQPDPVKLRRIGIFVLHGMGEQKRYGTLAEFAACIEQGLVERFPNSPRPVAAIKQYAHREHVDHKVVIELQPPGHDRLQLHILEFHWAALINRRVYFWQVLIWLFKSLFSISPFERSLGLSVNSSNRSLLMRLILRHKLFLQYFVGVLVILSVLLAVSSAVAISSEGALAFLRDAWQGLSRQPAALGIHRTVTDTMSAVLSGIGRSPADNPAVSWVASAAVGVFGLVLVTALLLIAQILTSALGWIQSLLARRLPSSVAGLFGALLFSAGLALAWYLFPDSPLKGGKTTVPTALLFALSTFALLKALQWLTHWVGDVMVYCNPDGSYADYHARRSIRQYAMERMEYLSGINVSSKQYQMDSCPAEFEEICLVGHSLGSVVMYETLVAFYNRLCALDREACIAGGDREQRFLEKFKVLLTYGSPLDKIKLFFHPRPSGNPLFDRLLLTDYLPNICGDCAVPNSLFNTAKWHNMWVWSDAIAGPLDEFGKVDNQHLGSHAYPPLANHSLYCLNREFREKVIKAIV